MTLQRAIQPSVLFDEVEGFTRVVNPDQLYDPTDALVVAYPSCFTDVELFRDILAGSLRGAVTVPVEDTTADPADDPAVEDATADPAVEEATAAPGEKRASRRRK